MDTLNCALTPHLTQVIFDDVRNFIHGENTGIMFPMEVDAMEIIFHEFVYFYRGQQKASNSPKTDFYH